MNVGLEAEVFQGIERDVRPHFGDADAEIGVRRIDIAKIPHPRGLDLKLKMRLSQIQHAFVQRLEIELKRVDWKA